MSPRRCRKRRGGASPSATGFIITGTGPASHCHVLEVFATGQPQKAEKINPLDGRIREFMRSPSWMNPGG